MGRGQGPSESTSAAVYSLHPPPPLNAHSTLIPGPANNSRPIYMIARIWVVGLPNEWKSTARYNLQHVRPKRHNLQHAGGEGRGQGAGTERVEVGSVAPPSTPLPLNAYSTLNPGPDNLQTRQREFGRKGYRVSQSQPRGTTYNTLGPKRHQLQHVGGGLGGGDGESRSGQRCTRFHPPCP